MESFCNRARVRLRSLAMTSLAAAMVALGSLSAGCGSTNSPNAPADPTAPLAASVAVSPATASVPVGGATLVFAATVANEPDQAVTWAVNGAPGGNSAVGRISDSGQYVSPVTMPASSSVTITAVSVADETISGTASLKLSADASSISVSVSPASANVVVGTGSQVFTATVDNATNTAVTWAVNGVVGGNSTLGTISTTGRFQAPASAPAQPTVQITAKSVEDPSQVGTASVTVTTVVIAPPTISGTPAASVAAGTAYSFTPRASSPRAATLTFAISNKPSWAAFSAATGALTGTPTTFDVGTFANITISVSDGTGLAFLAPFTITVKAATTGAATVSWLPPTTRTDGSTLTNLAGYNIYYGTAQGNYPNRITISNPSISTYVVSNLPGGATYYFVATAYDATGLESAYTSPGSKAIP